MALSLFASTLAVADPPGDGGYDRGPEHRHEQRADERGDHRDRREERRDEHRREAREYRRDGHRERFDAGVYRRPPGYYYRRWRRGDRLPPAFRAPLYVIPDVAVYHLRMPPPGYYWVRVNDNAVLAAIATGVVLDVVYNRIH
jgi:Ni/Co efflux regulator RcnB